MEAIANLMEYTTDNQIPGDLIYTQIHKQLLHELGILDQALDKIGLLEL
jgi:hypothetical protein